jgi:PAS domain S-box-containing protein
MLFTLDETGEFTLVTDSFAELLGTTRDDLVGRSLADVVAEPAAADRLLARTGASEAETTLVSVGDPGVEIPSRLSVAPFESPVGGGVVGTVRDIRELRAARREASQQRRRFTELFGSLTDPLVELEFGDGAELVTVNEPFVELAGVDADRLGGTPLDDADGLLPPALVDALEAVRDATEPVERELSLQSDDGPQSYLLRSVPYQSDGPERAFVVMTDVTELKRQETHLRVLHRLLRHNLRNQTNVIRGYADLIGRQADDDRVRSFSEQIEAAVDSLIDTSETAKSIQSVLETDEIAHRSLPAPDLVDRLEQLVESAVPEAPVRIDVDADTDVPYDDAVESALVELLDNAVTHGTPDADSTVTLSVRDRAETVRIAVTDDGSGIPDAEWAVVAGDREITQLQHSSGLGLWLAKWVAQRHGGTIRRLPADDGTTIAIDLPA